MTVGDVLAAVERLAPPRLAEEWDRVGLAVGRRDAPAGPLVLVAVDLQPAVVAEATARGARVVVVHHPPLFRPVSALTGGPVLDAAEAGVAVVCAHPNLDAARGGLNDRLCARLGIGGATPFSRSRLSLAKLVAFVPEAALDRVRAAVFAAGAGRVGDYDHCDFELAGVGRFRPLDGAAPAVGAIGATETVDEVRVETVVDRARVPAVVAALVAAHPYEEPAFDVTELATVAAREGVGRIGTLDAPLTVAALAARVAERLGLPGARVVDPGDPGRTVTRVAVCTGSGSGLLDAAARAGAEAYVTGDLTYHVADRAHELGVALVDAPHGPCEAAALDDWTPSLGAALAPAGVAVARADAWRDRWDWVART